MLQRKQTVEKGEVLGLNRITKQKLRDLCKKDKLYLTPSLNDVLYLHYQGFECIENLEEYTDLKCLWLESNAISEIQGLENQTKLKCLFLHNNLIRKIENLESCAELDTLNLSSNHIRKVENCGSDKLPFLTSLNLSSNYLTDFDALCELEKCKTLSVLDLSNNRIDDILIVKIFAKMPELRVLILQGNPVVSKLPQYRKTLILECRELTYLDSRPVFERDRACAEAWKRGGYMEERKESERWNRRERKKMRDSVNATIRMRNKHRSEDNQLALCSSSESEAEQSKNLANSMEMDAGLDMTADIWDEVKGEYHIPSTEPSVSSKDSSALASSSTSSIESLDVPMNEFKPKKLIEIVNVQNDKEEDNAELNYDSENNTENNIKNFECLESVVNNMVEEPIIDNSATIEPFDSDIDTSGFEMVERMMENSGKSAEEHFKETYGDAAQLAKTPEQMRKELIEEVETTKQLEISLGQLSLDIETRMEELQEEQDKLTIGNLDMSTDSEHTSSDSGESNEVLLTVNPKSKIFKHRQEQPTMQEQHFEICKSSMQLDVRGSKYEEYYKIVYDDVQKSDAVMNSKEMLHKDEKDVNSSDEIENIQIQTEKTNVTKDNYSFEQHSEHLYCNCFENVENETEMTVINEQVENLATTEQVNSALQTYIKQEQEVRGLLQQLEEENDRLYEINCLYEAVLENEIEKPNQTNENVCGSILNEIIHNLTLDANAVKNYKIIEAIEDEETTAPEDTNTQELFRTVSDVVGNFNKLMKNIISKNRAEKQMQQEKFKSNKSNKVVYTEQQKAESLKNLLKSPSLQEFNADTNESLDQQLDHLQAKQNKQIKRLVDRVYAQRERYNDTLELIDNKLVVVKKDSGEIEEIQPARHYFASDEDDDDFVQAATSLKNEEFWAEDGSELLSTYKQALNIKADVETDSDSNEEYYSLKNDTKLMGKIDNDFLQQLDFKYVETGESAESLEFVQCARSYEELKAYLCDTENQACLTTEEKAVLESMIAGPKDETRDLTSEENQLLKNLFERTKQKEAELHDAEEKERAVMQRKQKESTQESLFGKPDTKFPTMELADKSYLQGNNLEADENQAESLIINFETDCKAEIHTELPLSPKSVLDHDETINQLKPTAVPQNSKYDEPTSLNMELNYEANEQFQTAEEKSKGSKIITEGFTEGSIYSSEFETKDKDDKNVQDNEMDPNYEISENVQETNNIIEECEEKESFSMSEKLEPIYEPTTDEIKESQLYPENTEINKNDGIDITTVKSSLEECEEKEKDAKDMENKEETIITEEEEDAEIFNQFKDLESNNKIDLNLKNDLEGIDDVKEGNEAQTDDIELAQFEPKDTEINKNDVMDIPTAESNVEECEEISKNMENAEETIITDLKLNNELEAIDDDKEGNATILDEIEASDFYPETMEINQNYENDGAAGDANSGEERHKTISDFITSLYNDVTEDKKINPSIKESNQRGCIQLSVHAAKLFEYCCDSTTSVRNDDIIEIGNLSKDLTGIEGTFAANIDENEEESELETKETGIQCDNDDIKNN